MQDYLLYISRSALAAASFYFVYILLFRYKKQFNFNRLYLPLSLAASLLIPLVTLTKTIFLPETITADSMVELANKAVPDHLQIQEITYQWYHYIFTIYILGIAVLFLKNLIGHYKAHRLIKNSRMQTVFGIRVYLSKKDIHPFTFFNKIVLAERGLDNPALKMIVEHEAVHAREGHTWDILISELLFLLQWPNPFAWLLKNEIRDNLEYKTDNHIIKYNNAQAYQMAMVGLADKESVAPFLTALDASQLKNRIIMMKKENKNRFAFIKQLAVLPLLALLLMSLSNKKTITEYQAVQSQDFSVKGKVSNNDGEPIPAASIIIKGKTIGTITNAEGEYMIITAPLDSLVIRKKGYIGSQVAINKRKNIDIILDNNITVVATGEAKANKDKENVEVRIVNPEQHNDNILYIIRKDGKETQYAAKDLDQNRFRPKDIQSIRVIKEENELKPYGDYNGVVIIEMKENTSQQESTITSTTELRKYIAKNLIYPKNAADAGLSGSVKSYTKLGKTSSILKKHDKDSPETIEIDEVVVTALMKQDMVDLKEDNRDSNKSDPAGLDILQKEVERVLLTLPPVEIPNWDTKSVAEINVSFILQ